MMKGFGLSEALACGLFLGPRPQWSFHSKSVKCEIMLGEDFRRYGLGEVGAWKPIGELGLKPAFHGGAPQSARGSLPFPPVSLRCAGHKFCGLRWGVCAIAANVGVWSFGPLAWG